jgi:ABC-2 type transport system permease protein
MRRRFPISRRGFAALLRKELLGYFAQPLLYVVGGFFLLLAGYYFYSDLVFFVTFGFGQNIFENFFQLLFIDLRLVLLLTVPLLTMRLFAEEKRQATIELLFTYPLTDLEIFLAKMVACVAATLALLGATLVFLAFLHHLQPFSLGPIVAGYAGLALLSLSFVACGLFVSTLTDNQVVAAMATVGTLLLLWILSWNEAASTNSTLAWLTRLSMFDHFEGFSRGVVETKDLVFFASLVVLFGSLALESLGSRAWRRGQLLPTAVGLAGLAAALVVSSALAERYNLRFDLTPQRRYTISSHARSILTRLARDVEIVAFVRSGDPRNAGIVDLLSRLGEVSPRVHQRVVDVNRNPAMAQRYGVDVYGAIVVESGGQRRVFSTAREELLIGAMLELTRPATKTIYFSTGHGEGSPDDRDRQHGLSAFAAALRDEAYEVRTTTLESAVPRDATVLVIAGGTGPWPPSHLGVIEEWMRRGGRLLALLDPLSAPSLSAWLASHGIAPQADVVLDPDERIFGGEGVSIEARPAANVSDALPGAASARLITETLDQGVLLSLARSLEIDDRSIPLLKSGPQSWATTAVDRAERGFATFDGSRDTRGPLVVAAAREWPAEASGGRVVRLLAIGDSDCAQNAFIEFVANRDLLQNVANWLADEVDLIALRPRRKEIGREQFLLSAADARTVFVLGIVLVPGASLLVGLGLVVRRRWRR